MITIEFVGKSRAEGLHRPASDSAWLDTPVGFPVRSGGGPINTTCATCIHLILGESRWSNLGRAAPCGERRRLSAKRAQEVPIRWRSCSLYRARPNAEAELAVVDARFDEQAAEKRAKIKHYEDVIRRLNEELRELALLRQDPGESLEWRGFEPVGTMDE